MGALRCARYRGRAPAVPSGALSSPLYLTATVGCTRAARSGGRAGRGGAGQGGGTSGECCEAAAAVGGSALSRRGRGRGRFGVAASCRPVRGVRSGGTGANRRDGATTATLSPLAVALLRQRLCCRRCQRWGAGGQTVKKKLEGSSSWRCATPGSLVWGGFPYRAGRSPLPRREKDTEEGEAVTATTLNKLQTLKVLKSALGFCFFFSVRPLEGISVSPKSPIYNFAKS